MPSHAQSSKIRLEHLERDALIYVRQSSLIQVRDNTANTLVIDEEGIYDPGHYNDRLLLGFKGTMSEAELHWLKQRLLGGKLAKAEQGELRFRPPVGLVYDPIGKMVLDPDEEVQAAVRL